MEICKKNRGFTTPELAIVIIIFGMMMMGVMTAFKFYSLQQTDARTKEAFEVSQASLQAFVSNKRWYPCPASPTAARGSPEYGREQRDPATGKCTDTNDVRKRQVPRDQNRKGGNDWVYAGSVPFNTILDPNNDGNQDDRVSTGIPLTDASTYDGYGRRLTYAVTETLTEPLEYNDAYGTILVVDENRNALVTQREDLNNNQILDPGEDLNGNDTLDAGMYAHFVLISHGKNGRGATMPNGTTPDGCPNTLPIAIAPMVASDVNEIENCNDNLGLFLSGLLNEHESSYNDDILKFQITQTSGLWTYAGSDKRIVNTNGGNVGIGTRKPNEKLDINGRLHADFLNSDEYCDINDKTLCLQAAALGGDLPSMKCDPGEVITGIEDNMVHCAPAFDGSFTGGGCPAGCHGTGFERNSSGDTTLICRNSNNGRCALLP